MNFKTTVVLLVLLLVIAGVLWFVVRPGAPAATPAESEPAAPTALKPVFEPQIETQNIVRVEVAQADQPPLAFERIEDPDKAGSMADWKIVAPLTAPAEAFAVRGLINTLRGLQSRMQFEPGQKDQPTLADAGLAPPQATITLTDQDGKQFTLEVGKPVVLSSDTYVRVGDASAVHVADRDLAQQIRKPLDEYRAKRLVDLKLEEATRVRVTHEGRSYAFTRGADGEWVIDEPLRAYAAKDKVRSLIMRMNGLRAEQFAADTPESLAPYGLEQPYLSFSVTTETRTEIVGPPAPPDSQPVEPQFETTAREHTLLVGGFADLKREKRYVKPADQPWIATVAQTTLEGLVPKLKELRDPRVTRVSAVAATELTLAAGGQSATLKKIDGVWQGDGDLAALDQPAVNELLEAFEDLEAIDYVDAPEEPAAYGLAAPRATITVSAAGAVTPVTVRIGAETASGRNAYVQREGDPTVLVVRAAQAERLAVELLALRSREVFSFDADHLRQLTVQRPAMRYVLQRGDEGWTLAEPAEAPINLDAVRSLTRDLAQLRASRVVGKGNDAEFNLATPLTTLTFELEQPPASQPTSAAAEAPPAPALCVTHTLYVGRKDGVAYARRDNDPYIFELHDTVYQVLIGELVDPKLFSFRPDDVRSIKVESTGGTLALVKESDGWKYAPDPYVKLAQAKIDELAKDIARLRAEAYYAYRDGDLAAEQLDEPQAKLTIGLADGSEARLHLTQEQPGGLPVKAALVAEQRIFRLQPADCEKLLRGLDAYLVEDTPARP